MAISTIKSSFHLNLYGLDHSTNRKDGKYEQVNLKLATIFDAVAKGNASNVEAYIKTGVDVNAKDNDGWTPLHFAALFDRVKITGILIKHGAKIDEKTNLGATPLFITIRTDHVETAKILVECGADVNIPDNYGWTAIHHAVDRSHMNLTEIFLKNNGQIDAEDDEGKTPLVLAILSGQIEFAKFLIESGASVNITDGHGWSVLGVAANEGYTELTKVALEHGAKTNVKDSRGMTPREIAIQRGETGIVKLIDRKDGRYEQVDLKYATILVAAAEGNASDVEAHIKIGVNVNAKDNYGFTPLHFAALLDRVGIARILIDHGAKIAEKTVLGGTPLFIATSGIVSGIDWKYPYSYTHNKEGNVLVTKFLIEHGADVNIQDNDGSTALHNAADSGNTELIKILLENGAKIDTKNSFGSTALDLARTGDHEDAEKILEEAEKKRATNGK